MNIVTRMVVFVLLFTALHVLLFVIATMYNMDATVGIQDPVMARYAMRAAAQHFALVHWPPIEGIIILSSALMTFGMRWRVFVIAAIPAATVFLILHLAAIRYRGIFDRRLAQSPAAVALRERAATPQKRAVELFPELGVPDSPLSREFNRRYNRYQRDNPRYFADPEWPTLLARESYVTVHPR